MPIKDSFLSYYITTPVKKVSTIVWDFVRYHVLRRWYCEYCKMYHSPRVHKYYVSKNMWSVYITQHPSAHEYCVCSDGEQAMVVGWRPPTFIKSKNTWGIKLPSLNIEDTDK